MVDGGIDVDQSHRGVTVLLLDFSLEPVGDDAVAELDMDSAKHSVARKRVEGDGGRERLEFSVPVSDDLFLIAGPRRLFIRCELVPYPVNACQHSHQQENTYQPRLPGLIATVVSSRGAAVSGSGGGAGACDRPLLCLRGSHPRG